VGVADDPKHRESPGDKPVENKEIEDFFQRLPSNFRWPKPNAEAVAAAVEAIQRISGASAAAQELSPAKDLEGESGNTCSGCGGSLPGGARFCVWCGLAKDGVTGGVPPSTGQGQHHFHHHYHHLVPSQASPAPSHAPAVDPPATSPRGRAPGAPGPAPGGRAEVSARQVVQDWAQACNTRHIDDLLELYVPDATLIRSSVPPVRSLPAIREFLLSMLEAGLGDVEMESLRLEMMGDIAMDLGRCKMLVPVAMGKRREERGKYLVVLVKQPTGTWKILADCWAADSAVTAPLPTDPPARKATEAAAAPARKPR
jgi:ketosteroid isomerase-like protein